MHPLDVLMVVSEAIPFSKTGGLGDVGGALPAALARLGHKIAVVVPRYRGGIDGRVVAAFDSGAWPGGRDLRVLEHVTGDGVRFLFVDCPALFDRDGIYGAGGRDYADNDRRFALLARVALETAATLREPPDVLHAHDWQGGLAPVYLRTRFQEREGFQSTAAVFTIHNLAYQGRFPREVLPALDLPDSTFTDEGLEFWGALSFLKGGIVFSDMVTTVSRRYAREIQTSEAGFGFEGVLQSRADRLVGISNGIDARIWNPAADPFLPEPYSADDLRGKAAAKRALLARFGLAAAGHLPVIGMVSRMVDQKGFDIIAQAIGDLMRLEVAWVVLGTGEARYETMWQELAALHPDRVAVTIGFSEELAHLIEGGADMFLMPSRFEPCGLNQLYSLRYGTVPVVRATGGLDDTVTQVDHDTGEGTGFKFVAATADALVSTLRYALEWYRQPERWRRIQQAGMREDHSWDASAREYERVYARALKRTGRAVNHT